MGSNYSSANSAPYQYAFPPRKKRKMRSSESNHFDKNYLIEGTQFWAEKQYRKDSYFFHTSKRQSRENCTDGVRKSERFLLGVLLFISIFFLFRLERERRFAVPSSPSVLRSMALTNPTECGQKWRSTRIPSAGGHSGEVFANFGMNF